MEKKKIEVKKLSLLAGDASNRKYFQYFSSRKNYVIMYDNDEKNLEDFEKKLKDFEKKLPDISQKACFSANK